jgi:glutamate-1-semialdehyde 2,1-aminomutase
LTLKFNYGDTGSLEKLFDEYPGQIAAVILEPATTVGPCSDQCDIGTLACRDCPDNKGNFLHKVKEICRKNGTVFILDEMITGFRWDLKGAQHYFGIEPDLCTFGKAMANGFAVAALAGKREIMDIGGILNEGAERVFLVSTTHGAEMGALGAFMKTLEILERDKVVDHFWDYGRKLMTGMNDIAAELGIREHFFLEGYPCSPGYVTKGLDKRPSLEFRTLVHQEMIAEGVLMPYIALSRAHGDTDLEKTLEATKKALTIYRRALEGGIEAHLRSKAIKPVFRKFN